jgi:hypothetical protein
LRGLQACLFLTHSFLMYTNVSLCKQRRIILHVENIKQVWSNKTPIRDSVARSISQFLSSPLLSSPPLVSFYVLCHCRVSRFLGIVASGVAIHQFSLRNLWTRVVVPPDPSPDSRSTFLYKTLSFLPEHARNNNLLISSLLQLSIYTSFPGGQKRSC